jgi:hypothetical protein
MKLDLRFSCETIDSNLGSGLTVALIRIPEGMAYPWSPASIKFMVSTQAWSQPSSPP